MMLPTNRKSCWESCPPRFIVKANWHGQIYLWSVHRKFKIEFSHSLYKKNNCNCVVYMIKIDIFVVTARKNIGRIRLTYYHKIVKVMYYDFVAKS